MKHAKPFGLTQLLIPVGIGLVVIGWLFVREFSLGTFTTISFTWNSVAFILLAILFMFGRDLGLIFRFRMLSDKRLSWLQSFNIHILNEFTSAVTPSAVGGRH
jgi:glycosyltransferase 2 family protein